MTTKTLTPVQREQLDEQIETLAATEVAVESNQGTYGSQEGFRVVGCGDPAFCDYMIYERVGLVRGKVVRRVVGRNPEKAPGRGLQINARELVEARKRLAELLAQR